MLKTDKFSFHKEYGFLDLDAELTWCAKIKLMYFVILVKNNLLEIEDTFSLYLLLTDKLN